MAKYCQPRFNGHPDLTDKTLSPEGALNRGPTVYSSLDKSYCYIAQLLCMVYRSNQRQADRDDIVSHN